LIQSQDLSGRKSTIAPVPAFATIALLVFTYDIATYNTANGLTAGLALHPIVKVAAGRAREVRSGA